MRHTCYKLSFASIAFKFKYENIKTIFPFDHFDFFFSYSLNIHQNVFLLIFYVDKTVKKLRPLYFSHTEKESCFQPTK